MKKAKIYIPNKSAMQSGLGKLDKWILEFETNDPTKNPLMGWESSNDTYTELRFCLLYTSPSPRDISGSRMPSSA